MIGSALPTACLVCISILQFAFDQTHDELLRQLFSICSALAGAPNKRVKREPVALADVFQGTARVVARIGASRALNQRPLSLGKIACLRPIVPVHA